jgi:diaminohydroxyphosphoribosylaminopyrimidine deaminase/5-amino-6-(5-phosphoribosylamino)uracil reductase
MPRRWRWPAGTAARGATAYVTLEPCAHHGQTPPCADALIAAGIARVVDRAAKTPIRASPGRAIARLRAAGLAVDHRRAGGRRRGDAGGLPQPRHARAGRC